MSNKEDIEELKEKWHELLKLLKKKEIIDCYEQSNLELDVYLENKRIKFENT